MDKDDDAFFDREETVNGVATCIYKPVRPFTTDVSVEEVKRVVSVSESGLRWVTAEGSDEDPHRRANTFRKWILPLVPPHLAIAFDQPILFALSENSGGQKKRGGRRRSYPFSVGMKGNCSALTAVVLNSRVALPKRSSRHCLAILVQQPSVFQWK
jgi:hypothetical protein